MTQKDRQLDLSVKLGLLIRRWSQEWPDADVEDLMEVFNARLIVEHKKQIEREVNKIKGDSP